MREIACLKLIAGHKCDDVRVAMLDCADRMLQQIDAARAAVAVVHAPARTQPEPPREIDRVIGTECERSDAETINILCRKPGLSQQQTERLRQQLARRAVCRLTTVRHFDAGRDEDPIETVDDMSMFLTPGWRRFRACRRVQ